jgi:hypothetical protein
MHRRAAVQHEVISVLIPSLSIYILHIIYYSLFSLQSV